MKGFQVKHLPQGTQTFISNSCCWMKTSQKVMLYLRLEMRSLLFSGTSQCSQGLVKWALLQRARLSTPLCPGGLFPFIHHLHTKESLSVGLQLQLSLSNQCTPLVESWGQISGLSDSVGHSSSFILRLLGQLQLFWTSQQSLNLPEKLDCFLPMAHSLGNENPHPPSPCQEPS